MPTPKWFGKCFISAFNEEIKNTDTFKMALFTDAHAPDQDVDQYYDASHGMTEVSNGNGYTTGGVTLTNVSFAYDASTNVFSMKFDDASWAASSFTARYACVYSSTPSSNKPFIAFVDFESNQTSENGTFKVDLDASTNFVKVTIS